MNKLLNLSVLSVSNSKINGTNNSTLPHRQVNIAEVLKQLNSHNPNGLNFSRDSTTIAWMIRICYGESPHGELFYSLG